MGNFNAANVIKAAATSDLGVISLIVLVLAFLAWRFFQRSSDRVKLIAFATMFLGAAGFVAAVMLAGGDAPTADAQASATPPSTAPTTAAPGHEVSSHSPGGAPNIDGAWHDSDGYDYAFHQDGDAFTYQVVLKGQVVGHGAGTIAGPRLIYRYTQTDGSQGTCEGRLSADATMISGKCRDGSAEWEFSIQR